MGTKVIREWVPPEIKDVSFMDMLEYVRKTKGRKTVPNFKPTDYRQLMRYAGSGKDPEKRVSIRLIGGATGHLQARVGSGFKFIRCSLKGE